MASATLGGSDMKDARVEEIRQLLPQAMLPDWVRLGGRMVRLLRDRFIRKRTTPFWTGCSPKPARRWRCAKIAG